MGLRVVRHLGARSVPADDSKILAVMPLFPGETVSWMNISAYFASGDDSSVDQPSECNWYGISIPWPILWATGLRKGAGVETMAGVPEWDELYKDWLLETSEGTPGGERYGGDVDSDPEEVEGEQTTTGDEEMLDSGPIGPYRWFSREVVMRPYAAEGNNVIRFGDDFEAHLSRFKKASYGQVLLFGMVRYEHSVETNFNLELDDATAQRAIGLLISGDYPKVQSVVESDSGALGDWIRTVLFGGDTYIEQDTLKGAAGKAAVKIQLGIDSPLHERMR